MVHDFVKKTDELRQDIRDFFVSPERWRKSKVRFTLSWTSVSFVNTNKRKIPKNPGVYAFVVRHVNNHFPEHGFIMYIGITGAGGNGRTLRDRYGDYLREKNDNKRPKVHYMLNKYSEDLHFSYSPIDVKKIDLEKLELDLNDAIIPPIVTKDFTAEIRSLVSALR